MFPFVKDYKKPYLLKSEFNRVSTLMQPLKLLYLLQEIEFSQRPLSKFNPHVQIDSEVVIWNIATGDRRRINLVSPFEKETSPNAVSFSSQLGVALLGHKINHIIECTEGEVSTLWKIIAINIKEKI